MGKTTKDKIKIIFLVSISIVVMSIGNTIFISTKLTKSQKNKELLFAQTRNFESLSRKILQNYILKSSDRDYSFNILNREMDMMPQIDFIKKLAPVLKNGGEIIIDRVIVDYPPLSEEFHSSIDEIKLLINAFFNIKRVLTNDNRKDREGKLVLLTTIINQLTVKSKAIYRKIEEKNQLDKILLYASLFVTMFIAIITFAYFFFVVIKNVFKPLGNLIDITDEISNGNLNKFVPQPHYVKCCDEKKCQYTECPSYNSRNKACWRIKNTFDDNGNLIEDRFVKSARCLECKVYKKSIRNDIDNLIESVNNMIVSFKKIITSIKNIVSDVNDEANVLNGISNKLKNDSEIQATSFEETSSAHEELIASIQDVDSASGKQAEMVSDTMSSMEQLSSTIRVVGDNSMNVSESTRDTVEEAKKTGTMLQNTTESINQISVSSEKIVDIISIINDISDQINLLSLNASIEAARAGEHGKGFAVVAEEISKLAEATASSTKQIETHISKSSHDIQNGASLVMQTANAINKMIENIENAANLISEIAVSADEQTKGSEKVMMDIEVINNMSDQIAKITGEQKMTSTEIMKAITLVNESIQELVEMAHMLTDASESITNKTENLEEEISEFNI